MGILPVLARLPKLVRRIGQTAEAIVAARPDALVIIDSPDFTHRVARRVRKALPDLPIVDYVSPSVWAWRPGRAKAMRAYVDCVLGLLPFEPEAYVRLGGPRCVYVGHPLIERLGELRPNEDEARRRAAEPPVVVVLPGSRRSEIRRLMDDFGGALHVLREAIGSFTPVLPTLPHIEEEVRRRAAAWPVTPRIVLGEAQKFEAFRRARAALAASGTVTLELALAGVPMVGAYKVSLIEEQLKYLIKVPSILLPNLILGERSIPEKLQRDCNPAELGAALAAIMRDGPRAPGPGRSAGAPRRADAAPRRRRAERARGAGGARDDRGAKDAIAHRRSVARDLTRSSAASGICKAAMPARGWRKSRQRHDSVRDCRHDGVTALRIRSSVL